MNYMDGQAESLQHCERAGRHDIPTVQDRLGTRLHSISHRRLEQDPVVMAVGNDTDLHS